MANKPYSQETTHVTTFNGNERWGVTDDPTGTPLDGYISIDDARHYINPGRVRVLKAMPPAASAATIDYRAGGSSPGEQVLVWDFDSAAIEYMDFLCVLEHYNGNGLTFTLPWSSDGATTGDVIWGVAIRRMQDDAEDIDTSQTYDFNSVTDTTASASGELSYPTIAFTDGADMDSWANGELAIVRVRRHADQAGDTMNSNDAELWALRGVET